MKKKIIPYLLILPHFLFFLTFVIYPIGKSVRMSFSQWGLFQGFIKNVGLENFKKLFLFDGYKAQHYWMAMGVTLKFVIFFVPLLLILSLAIATFLKRKELRFKQLHMSAVFLPIALSITAVASVWKWIFNYDTGLINYVLSFFNIGKVTWLLHLPWVWFSLVITTLWWTLGWSVLIIYGGLSKIPENQYEAAQIDGANRWQRFINVTLPGLKDVMMFVVITQVLASFGLFGQPQLMTGGNPGRATIPVMLHIYGEAFNASKPRMGEAAAMSLLTGAIILAFTFTQYYLFNREKKETGHGSK